VRVDVTLTRGETTLVQLSRGAASELNLAPNDQVWVTRTGVRAELQPEPTGVTS
jgi:hypothetical protein